MSVNNSNKVKQSEVVLDSNYKVELVTTHEGFNALRDDWCLLNKNASKSNLFTSWDWLNTWWEVYKNNGKRELYILKYIDNNHKLIGLAPFQIINNPKKYFPCSRQLLFLGAGEIDGSLTMGEYIDLLIIPGYETAVINAFSAYLYENKRLWDGIKFSYTLEHSHLSQLFSGEEKHLKHKIIKSIHSYGFRTLITLPETYKDYLMGLKKKMRNNITRTFSRLEKEQDYSIESINSVEECDKAITILTELNLTRRDNMGESSAFESEKFIQFHREITKRLLVENNSNQTISLRILYFGNEPVAALYSFIDGDTIHAYQSGFETESGHRYSLLTTMLTQEISNSIENKQLKYFNFMFADEEATYKKRYSGETEIMYELSFDNSGMKYSAYRFIHGPVKDQVKKILKIK